MSRPPLISIGLPAFNSERNIEFTLDGLLAQTFTDFELIVSDNASTDGTRDLVERYARQDSRIRYERQDVNIGGHGNHAFVARRARGELFKWSSSSDWCAPTFLERCKNELLAHDDTVLVAPRTRLFQQNLASAEDYPGDIQLLEEAPSARFVALVSTLSLNNAMSGLIRTAALRRTTLLGNYLGADSVLMGQLALLGKFRLLEERLFYRRMDVASATALQDRESVWRFHYPTRTSGALFQGFKRHAGWARAALSPAVPVGERLRSLQHVAKRCYWDRQAFVRDIQGAWRYYGRGGWPD